MTGGGTKTFASTVLSHQSATGASVWTDGLLNGTFGGALNNSGLVDFSGFGSVVGTAPGTFTNSGTITVSADGPRIDTGTDNTGGLIHVTGGQLRHTVGWTNAGTVQVDSGTLFIVDGGAFGNTGTVISNGTIQGLSFSNDGTLAAGASPGKTVINMPLTLLSNSIIEAELGGTNQGVDYDWIEVINNAVTLGGTLNVTHFGGFTPSSNDQFLIITAATGGVSGSFATINTPAGFAYTTTVNPNDFTVEFQFIPDTFWDDGGDGLNWTDPDNWSTDLVPGGGDNVLIAFGGGNTVTLASGTQATKQLVTQDTLTVSGGTLDVSGNAGLDATLTLTGGTTTLTGGGNLADLDIVNGDLFVNTTPLTVSDLSITGSGGVLGGDTDVTVTSAGTWSSGSMFGTGKTIVGGGAVLDINLSNAKTLDTRELENLGVINWNDGGVFVQNGPTLDNQGTFNALLSGSSRTFNFNGGALGTFTNTGTFIGNTGAAVATFDMALNHTGATAMDIQSGTVVFNDGGTSSGDFGIQTGATVVFATAGNETHALSGTISGAGSVGLGTAGSSGIVNLDASSVYDIGATTQIIGGTANFDGTLLDLGVRLLGTAGVANFDETNGPIVHGLDDLDIVNAQLFFNVNDVQTTNLTITGSSGVLGGGTDVTVTSAGTWSSGSMFGTGKTIVGGGAVLDINLSNAKTLDTRELENLGVINWNDGGVFVQNGPTLDNQGTFNALLSGSSRTFRFNGGAAATLNNTGTLNSNTGAALATFDMNLTNTGTIDVQSGSLVITGTYDQTAGTTQLSGGALFSTLQPINIHGGTLAGAGTITADVNVDTTGVLTPGTSPDILVIDGDLTLGPGSKTDIEIIGTTPGPTGFDQIQVSGNVVLDGELEVFLPNTPPFNPTGNAFQIFLCGTTAGTCSGTFATITGPFGTTFNVDVNANDVELNTFVVSPLNIWIGAVDDSWNVTGNWSLGTIPVIGEAVLIDESVDAVTTTITIDGATTAEANQLSSTKNFNMTGGTFDVTNNSSITADLTMSNGTTTLGGTLDVQTVTITGGTLTVNGTATINVDLTVNSTGVANLVGAASVAGTLSQTGGTTNLNAAATYAISSLDLSSSAVLSVTDAATVMDVDTAFDFDQGSINGLGTVNLLSGTAAQLTGFNTKTIGAGVTLSNDTTFNFASTNSLTLEGTLDNNNLAVIDLQGNVGIAGNGALNNLAGGTIVKSAGAGTSTLIAVAGTTNSGLIDVQSGTIQFNTGVAHTSGELRLSTGDAVIIGGAHTFDATSSITDPGLDDNFTVQTGGTTFTMNGAYTVGTTTTVTGATANFNTNADFSTLDMAGTVNLNLAGNTYTASTLNLLLGTLNVTGATSSLDIDTTFNWDTANLGGSGTFNLLNTSTAQLTGNGNKLNDPRQSRGLIG